MAEKIHIQLESIHVASPCNASWDKMHGNDVARLCQSCDKTVYNLSEMTRDDAEAVIAEHGGRLCVRFYQRSDGTVMTSDCPVGLRRTLQRRVRRLAAAGAFAVAWMFWVMQTTVGRASHAPPSLPENLNPGSAGFIQGDVAGPEPAAAPTPTPRIVVMGKMAMPRPEGKGWRSPGHSRPATR